MQTRGWQRAKPVTTPIMLNPKKAASTNKTLRRRERVVHGRLSRWISIVIPAHNEERYLRETLGSLHRQNYPWYETVVVANGCTDRTAEVAKGNCHRLIVLSQKSL